MSKNDLKTLCLLFLILLLSGLLLLSRRGAKDQASLRQNQLVQKINQSLKDTKIKNEINQLEVDIGNENGPQIDSSVGGGAPAQYDDKMSSDKVNPLSFEQENSGQQVLKDIEYESRRSRNLTPEQRINSKLEREAWIRDHENRERELVVKQFLENARERGVDIRLNKNLDIIGVAPVQGDKPILFKQPQSGDILED